jgi:hypothetical protein
MFVGTSFEKVDDRHEAERVSVASHFTEFICRVNCFNMQIVDLTD